MRLPWRRIKGNPLVVAHACPEKTILLLHLEKYKLNLSHVACKPRTRVCHMFEAEQVKAGQQGFNRMSWPGVSINGIHLKESS
jgi:hypothetical protein